MAYDENTSRSIARDAAELLHHPDPKVRRVAASALTQVEDRIPPLVKRLLDELVRIYQPGVGLGPYKNGHYQVALQRALEVARPRRPDVAAALTIAASYASPPPQLDFMRRLARVNALTAGRKR